MTAIRMTWSEMVEKYPDKWVVVDNPIMDGDSPDIIEGDVVAVVDDDKIDNYEIDNLDKGYIYRRTTEGFCNGITGSSITICVS